MDDYQEWLSLIHEAKEQGITTEEIRKFIQQAAEEVTK